MLETFESLDGGTRRSVFWVLRTMRSTCIDNERATFWCVVPHVLYVRPEPWPSSVRFIRVQFSLTDSTNCVSDTESSDDSGVQGGIAILGNPPTEVQFEFTVFSLLERRAERRAEWTIAKSRHGSLRNGAYQEKSLRFACIDFNAYSTFLRPQPIDDRYLRNATR